jgi:hypothetical protein
MIHFLKGYLGSWVCYTFIMVNLIAMFTFQCLLQMCLSIRKLLVFLHVSYSTLSLLKHPSHKY